MGVNASPTRSRFRRFFYFRRRALAVLATVLAVFATVSALQPDRGETVPVLAAARDLPGGTVLAAGDLVPLSLPAGAAPGAAVSEASELVGRALNGPVSARSVLTRAAVATGQSLARPGYVVVALPLDNDALAPLVAPGARIDLIDPSGASGAVLASDVRVVGAPSSASGLSLGAPDRAALIEVLPEVATKVAAATRSGGLTIALR